MFERNNSFERRKSSSLYPLARGWETNARYRCSREHNNFGSRVPRGKTIVAYAITTLFIIAFSDETQLLVKTRISSSINHDHKSRLGAGRRRH